MQVFNVLTSKVAAFLTALLLAATCFIAVPNEADAAGFEFTGGFGYAALPDPDSSLDYHGFAFTLGFGYRINDWVGVAIDQDLGGLFYNKHGYDIDVFQGATMFEAKFYFPIVSSFEIGAKVGIGATYMADEGNDDGWFAIRIGVNGTYFITSNVGIGLNFDYTPSFANDDHNGHTSSTGHFLKLQAHLMYRF